MKRFLTILPIIGLILGAVAIATEIKTTDSLPIGQQLSGIVVSCIKTAVEKRDTAIISAVTTYQTTNLTALSARKTDLISAWAKSTKTDIKAAISATWKTYKATLIESKTILQAAKKAAWSTYKTEVKSCKGQTLVGSVDSSSVANEQ